MCTLTTGGSVLACRGFGEQGGCGGGSWRAHPLPACHANNRRDGARMEGFWRATRVRRRQLACASAACMCTLTTEICWRVRRVWRRRLAAWGEGADAHAAGVAEGVVVGHAEIVGNVVAEGVANGVAICVAKGVAEGVAIGVAKGVAEGVAIGVANGVAEGVAVDVEVLRVDVAWHVHGLPVKHVVHGRCANVVHGRCANVVHGRCANSHEYGYGGRGGCAVKRAGVLWD
eukprot:365084-Chlamydomonas_euryale.AAC.1